MTITIDTAQLLEVVKRSLSIIGKRSVDNEGNLLFKDITLSSREESIVSDYIGYAVNVLAAELSGFVTGSTGGIVVTFPSNQNSQLDTFIIDACKAFVVAYSLYSWFTITAPNISKKYQEDMTNQLAAIVRMTHEKTAPTASSSGVLDTGTSVS